MFFKETFTGVLLTGKRPVEIVVLTMLVSLAGAKVARAQPVPSLVAAGKEATGLLVSEKYQRSGTAFCISPGYFVTNEHVAGQPGDELKLILHSAEDDESLHVATVLRADADLDLAVLHSPTAKDVTPLPLGKDESLFETLQTTVFGYPLGTALSYSRDEFPSISISVGRISALRKRNGKLGVIQLDAVVNPGNSGGPVLSPDGKVIGVIAAKLGDSDLNLAIPVSHLQRYLEQPDVAFVLPQITRENWHERLPVKVEILSINRPQPVWNVELTWDEGTPRERLIALQTTDGRLFSGSVVPLPLEGEQQINVTARFSPGAVQGLIDDVTIGSAEQSQPLRNIRRILKTDEGYQVELRDGTTFAAKSLRLPESLRIGAHTVRLPLADASSISLAPQPGPKQIRYRLVVTQDDRIVHEQESILMLAAAEDRSTTVPPLTEATDLQRMPLTSSYPWPAFLAPSSSATLDGSGLRTQGRRYVYSRQSDLLTKDFTAELEFELEPKNSNEWGQMYFVGIGTQDRAAYEEPKHAAYLRMTALQLKGEIGLSNRPVSYGTPLGRLTSVGPHLVRIRKRGDAVTFEIDADSDGPSPDDMQRTIPSIREFVPVLHEKNTHLFFGGAARFRSVAFQID